MVSFTEIAYAISENSEKGFSVNSCIPKHQLPVEKQKINVSTDKTSIEPSKNPFDKISLRMQPLKSVSQITEIPIPLARSFVTPSLLPTSIQEETSDSEVEPPLPTLRLAITENKVETYTQLNQTLSNAIVTQNNVESVSIHTKSFPNREERISLVSKPKSAFNVYRKPMDPICIGISERDALYEIASASVKQSIEAEEARILEAKIAELYKNEAGRSRGWTKKDLEAFFQIRAASGSSLPAKQSFIWPSIFTNKQTSAQLDFVCLAKGIRLAVWNDTEKCIGIWPAADLSTSKHIPLLFHVNQNGCPIQKTSIFETGWKLRAAISVEHGLEKLSVDELENLAERMGIMAQMTGRKTERVRILAAARTEQRLR